MNMRRKICIITVLGLTACSAFVAEPELKQVTQAEEAVTEPPKTEAKTATLRPEPTPLRSESCSCEKCDCAPCKCGKRSAECACKECKCKSCECKAEKYFDLNIVALRALPYEFGREIALRSNLPMAVYLGSDEEAVVPEEIYDSAVVTYLPEDPEKAKYFSRWSGDYVILVPKNGQMYPAPSQGHCKSAVRCKSKSS